MRLLSATLLLFGLAAAARAQDAPRLMTAERHARSRALLPRFAEPRLDLLRRDPRLLLYTEQEIPPAFQAADRGRLGVFAAGTRFLVAGVPVGTANAIFPWRAPFGLEFASGWEAFRFLHVPEGERIVWSFEPQPGDVQGAAPLTWEFPEGTVFGEVLLLTSLGTPPVAFEVRTRTKAPPGWRVDVFRPHRNRAELDLAVAVRDPAGAAPFAATRQFQAFTWGQRQVRALHRSAVKDLLAPLPPVTVRNLLDGATFQSVRGVPWADGADGPDAAGPGIVPQHYDGAFVPVTMNTCASCHRTAGKNVNQFRDAGGNRFRVPAGWDEWVRGSATDQALSFHPFDPASISRDGRFLTVALNPKLMPLLTPRRP